MCENNSSEEQRVRDELQKMVTATCTEAACQSENLLWDGIATASVFVKAEEVRHQWEVEEDSWQVDLSCNVMHFHRFEIDLSTTCVRFPAQWPDAYKQQIQNSISELTRSSAYSHIPWFLRHRVYIHCVSNKLAPLRQVGINLLFSKYKKSVIYVL